MRLIPRVTKRFRVPGLIWNHPANRGRRVRAFAQAAIWQVYKRLTNRPWDFQLSEMARVRCYRDSGAANALMYFSGRPEYHELAFLTRYLREGDHFLDIGANVGIYSTLAGCIVGASGSVLAFEPGMEAQRRLRENLRLSNLSNVTVHGCALGAERGQISFTIGRDTINRIATSQDTEVCTVPCERLDDMVPKGIRFAMAKIDVEGAEALVLRGAERLLAAGNPPVWQLEWKDRLLKQYDSGIEQLTLMLRDSGYELAVFDADVGELRFEERYIRQRDDVLAIAQSARDSLAARLGQS